MTNNWSKGYFDGTTQYANGNLSDSFKQELISYIVLKRFSTVFHAISSNVSISSTHRNRLADIFVYAKHHKFVSQPINYWNGYFSGIADTVGMDDNSAFLLTEILFNKIKQEAIEMVNRMKQAELNKASSILKKKHHEEVKAKMQQVEVNVDYLSRKATSCRINAIELGNLSDIVSTIILEDINFLKV